MRRVSYSASALELFWDRQPDTVVAYQVVGSNGTNITVDGTSLFVDGLVANTQFTFTVTAIDFNGNDTVSESIELTTLGSDNAAVAVVNLRGEVYSSSAVEIFWDVDNAPAGTAFNIFRDGSLVGTTDGRSFFEEGLPSGTAFTYTVEPQNAGASATVTLNTLGGVSGVSGGLDAIGLVYADTYRIERDGELLDERGGLSFFDSGLASATVFTYLVIAVSSDGSVVATDSIVLTTGGSGY